MVMKIKDIMSPKVITVSVETTVEEAANIMESKPISCVVVMHHRHPVGILTERDIVQGIIVESRDPRTTQVGSIMKKSMLSVDPDDPITKVFDIIQKYGIRHLPVTRGTELFGLISQSDIMRGFRKIEQDLEESLASGKLSMEEYAKKRKEFLQETSKKQDAAMFSTGSADLDALLGGGLSRGTSIAIEGPPGSGKGLLGFLFLIDGMRRGEKGIYVFMGDTVENIRNGFRAFGIDTVDYVKKDLLSFIELKPHDAFAGNPDLIIISLDDPKSLVGKVDELASRSSSTRIVLDTLSHQVMFLDIKTLYRHVYQFSDACRIKKWSALYIIEEGISEPSNIVSLEQLMDGLIQIKYSENKNEIERRLIAKKMEGGRMVPQKFFTCQFDAAKGLIICPPNT